MDEPGDDGTRGDDGARLREVIKSGSELTGAAIGGAVGLMGGPPGAIGGAMAGVTITKVLTRVGLEVHDRLIVRRQQERVGRALGVMEHDAAQGLAAGHRPRDDGFFETPPDGRRSDAEEVLEGVLRAAADANQERKLRHLGAVFPSLAVRDDVDTSDAHWLVHTAEQVSWRQMVVLALLADPPVDDLKTQGLEEAEGRGRPCASVTLAEEVEELGRLGLVGTSRSDGKLVRAGATIGSIGQFWAVPMVDWKLTAAGALLVDVTRLCEINGHERETVLRLLLDQGASSG